VLKEGKIAFALAIAQHLRMITQTKQWTHYDLKTAEQIKECQQQLTEVEEAFNPPSVPIIPTVNQLVTEDLKKAEQAEVKQSTNPLLLKGIIEEFSFRMSPSVSLPPVVIEVLRQLQHATYAAYLVGGAIRDLLLDKLPNDFDIITTAPLDVLLDLYKQGNVSQRIPNLYKLTRDHWQIDILVYSEISLNEDALKRDFTINALFADANGKIFDPLRKSLNDMKTHTLAFITTPEKSIREDPLRLMLLARLIVRTNWKLPSSLQTIISEFAPLIRTCEPGRLSFECRKHFLRGKAVAHYHTLYQLNLLQALFPSTVAYLTQETVGEYYQQWLLEQLQSTDERVQSGKSVSLEYIFSIFDVGHLFWHHPELHTDISNLMQKITPLTKVWYRRLGNFERKDLVFHIWPLPLLANDYFDYQSQAKNNRIIC
jgi:Poly A polymerase head domain/Probable RNA and SrmB- binding site of polymerase A